MDRFARFQRVTTIAICLLCSLPQQGICGSISIEQIAVNLANYEPSSSVFPTPLCIGIGSLRRPENPFEVLTEAITEAEDPLGTTRQFFHAFLAQINAQKGTTVTIEEACQLIRQNVDLLPPEHRESLILGVNAIESNNSSGMTTCNTISSLPVASLYWPWEWNWFGLNKKEKKHHHQHTSEQTNNLSDGVLIFATIAAALTLVAIFNASALPVVVSALLQAAQTIANNY